MKELQNKARQSLTGETHNIYRAKFSFILLYIGTWKVTKNEIIFLEEKCGKLINVKLFNDEGLKQRTNDKSVR